MFDARTTFVPMKTKRLCVLFLLTTAVIAPAAEGTPEQDLLKPVKYSTEWKPNPSLYQSILSEKPAARVLTLRRREYTLRGPLFEAFRPSRATTTDDFIDGKLRRIPIVNLLVPYKMATAPENKSKYFRWQGRSARGRRPGRPGSGRGTSPSSAVQACA